MCPRLVSNIAVRATCAAVLFAAIALPIDFAHDRWTAHWIRVPGADPAAYGVYHFRRTFDITHAREHLRVFVSADNRYQLFLNGELISLGPARGDLFHWRYEAVDLGPKVRIGRNTLAAVVWNEGPNRAVAQISSSAGFLLQAEDAADASLNTSAAWRCTIDRAYTPELVPKDQLVGYTALGPNEHVDGAAYPWGWEQPDFNDASWVAAQDVSPGSPRQAQDGPNPWMLTASRIPEEERTVLRLDQVRSVSGVALPPRFPRQPAPFVVPAHAQVTMLLDQSYLTTAYPELTVSGGARATVRLHYAEALYTTGLPNPTKGNRNDVAGKLFLGRFDTFLPDGGAHRTYKPLFWRTYRYLKLDIQTAADPLTIEDLRGVFTAYPFERRASLQLPGSNLDATVQKILDTGWRTARLCAHETYMDCPYYEQLQYAGDARIQMLVSLYNTGDSRLMRNGIEELNSSRTSEGATYSRAPSALPQYIPPFSLWWIGMVHDYWMYVDDPEFARAMLPGVEAVLRFFAAYQNENGSLRALPWWNFVDWAPTWRDGVPPCNADHSAAAAIDLQLTLAYDWAADLEKAFGDDLLAFRYRTAASRLRETIRATDWDPARQIFADQPEQRTYSQQVNTLAALAEVLPPAQAHDALLRALADPSLEHSSIYFQAYTNEALANIGEGATYLQRLTPWLDMLQQGLTTWAEIDTPETRSDCHAWGASPNIELFRIVAGIRPGAPGYASVHIEPNLGGLTHLRAAVPHPKGIIEVEIDASARRAIIRLPAAVPGAFVWRGKTYSLHPGETRLHL